MTFQRIRVDPKVSGGKPTIRGLRVPGSRLLGLLASGESRELILKAYPYLEPEDIQEALTYAACLADDEVFEGDRWAEPTLPLTPCLTPLARQREMHTTFDRRDARESART